jgi:hypothetical protein
MREITKAQLTIGLLAYFAAIWWLIFSLDFTNLPVAVGIIILWLFLLLIISYVLIALLEWIKIFDLKTNAIITLLVINMILLGQFV